MLYSALMSSNLSNMKVKFILLFSISLSFMINAQALRKLHEFKPAEAPVAISIDRNGKLYFGSQDGVVSRYDKEGNLEFNNAPSKRYKITLIEAWQGLKTFVYSAPFQEYIFLDRFFNNSEFYHVEKNDLRSFDGLATIENDQTLWAFNTESQTLRKIDLFNNEVIFDNQLNLTLDIDEIDPEHIRVYQNLVFISEKDHGIAIFDNLGGFLDFIPKKGIAYFSFNKNEIILYDGKSLQLIDIYKKTKREIALGNLSFDYVMMENNQIIGISAKTIQRFEILN